MIIEFNENAPLTEQDHEALAKFTAALLGGVDDKYGVEGSDTLSPEQFKAVNGMILAMVKAVYQLTKDDFDDGVLLAMIQEAGLAPAIFYLYIREAIVAV